MPISRVYHVDEVMDFFSCVFNFVIVYFQVSGFLAVDFEHPEAGLGVVGSDEVVFLEGIGLINLVEGLRHLLIWSHIGRFFGLN